MDLQNFQFKQKLLFNHMIKLQEASERTLGNIVKDFWGERGLAKPIIKAYASTTPDWSVHIPAGGAYCKVTENIGNTGPVTKILRVGWDTVMDIDCETDSLGMPVVPSAGNTRYLSVFIKFKRDNQMPLVNYRGEPYFYYLIESYDLIKIAGLQTTGTPERVPFPSDDHVLLCDILLDSNISATGIQNAIDPANPDVNEIDLTRVEFFSLFHIESVLGNFLTADEIGLPSDSGYSPEAFQKHTDDIVMSLGRKLRNKDNAEIINENGNIKNATIDLAGGKAIKDGETNILTPTALSIDLIQEKTANNGITIAGTSIKAGKISNNAATEFIDTVAKTIKNAASIEVPSEAGSIKIFNRKAATKYSCWACNGENGKWINGYTANIQWEDIGGGMYRYRIPYSIHGVSSLLGLDVKIYQRTSSHTGLKDVTHLKNVYLDNGLVLLNTMNGNEDGSTTNLTIPSFIGPDGAISLYGQTQVNFGGGSFPVYHRGLYSGQYATFPGALTPLTTKGKIYFAVSLAMFNYYGYSMTFLKSGATSDFEFRYSHSYPPGDCLSLTIPGASPLYYYETLPSTTVQRCFAVQWDSAGIDGTANKMRIGFGPWGGAISWVAATTAGVPDMSTINDLRVGVSIDDNATNLGSFMWLMAWNHAATNDAVYGYDDFGQDVVIEQNTKDPLYVVITGKE